MALSEIDRTLLQRCLAREPRSWEEFVDRFMGLVVHVINHSAQSRSIRLSRADHEDLAGEVFLTLVKNDFAVLQSFRGSSSLATYLTVVARRVVVRELLKRKTTARLAEGAEGVEDEAGNAVGAIEDRDEVQQLLGQIDGSEAEIVRMYHLDGKSYREISQATGVPENSIGPTLSRARGKMRRASEKSARERRAG